MPWLDPIIALQRGLNVLAAVSKGMQAQPACCLSSVTAWRHESRPGSRESHPIGDLLEGRQQFAGRVGLQPGARFSAKRRLGGRIIEVRYPRFMTC
jgi:hypothetical protein